MGFCVVGSVLWGFDNWVWRLGVGMGMCVVRGFGGFEGVFA